MPSDKHNSGNKKMEKVWSDYSSHDIAVRKKATPIILVEQASVAGKSKGYRRFVGFGIVTKIEMRQEFDVESDGVFSNYLFEVSLFTVPPSGLDWQWIYDR